MKRNVYLLVIILIALFGVLVRISVFDLEGGDHPQYRQALTEFNEGVNPYKYTVQSFTIKTLDHGYAYFPTLLYILSFFWRINEIFAFDIPTAYLFKIPVLLADGTIFVLLAKYFYEKRAFVPGILSVAFWTFNPYLVANYEYTLFDPIQVLFLFVALILLKKDSFTAAVFFALACSMKIIPIVLLPILILNTPKKIKFVLGFAILFVLISLPFAKTVEDLHYYLQGTVFVHSERGIQGRPLLTFLTFYLQRIGVSFYQSEYSGFYSVLALITATVAPLVLYFKKNVTDVYVLTTSSFLAYFLFTPVLSRTHLLWMLPFLLIAVYQVFYFRKQVVYYAVLTVTYLFMTTYYMLWVNGLRAPKTYGGEIWISSDKRDPKFFPGSTRLRNKYYDYRHKLLEAL